MEQFWIDRNKICRMKKSQAPGPRVEAKQVTGMEFPAWKAQCDEEAEPIDTFLIFLLTAVGISWIMLEECFKTEEGSTKNLSKQFSVGSSRVSLWMRLPSK